MVDYVVIDLNERPLENISIIQPDYFAKASNTLDRHAHQDRGRGGDVKSYGGR